jgi:hypothetical protein
MQYLLMDCHQRFIGTFDCHETLAVGDTFESQNAQSYTVVGLNRLRHYNSQVPSLTVIPVKRASVPAS